MRVNGFFYVCTEHASIISNKYDLSKELCTTHTPNAQSHVSAKRCLQWTMALQRARVQPQTLHLENGTCF